MLFFLGGGSRGLPRRDKTLLAKPCHLAWLFSTRKARNFRNYHPAHSDSMYHRFAMGGCHGTPACAYSHSPFLLRSSALSAYHTLLCIEDAQLQTLCASACQKIQLLRATQNNLYVLQYHTDSHCCSPFDGFPLVRYILRWASPASPVPLFCDEQATHIYILNTLLF